MNCDHALCASGWKRRATASIVKFSEESKASYGYLWWVYDLPYQGRTVRAYFASGNGGQFSFGIDELGLAVVFQGGSYNDWDAGYAALRDLLDLRGLEAALGEDPDGRLQHVLAVDLGPRPAGGLFGGLRHFQNVSTEKSS